MRLKKVASAILAASVVVAVVSLGLKSYLGVSAASAASSGSDFSILKPRATITHETTNCSSEIAAIASSYAYQPWSYSANATANSSFISCNNPAWYSDSFDVRTKLHFYNKKDFKSDMTSGPLLLFLSPLSCSQIAGGLSRFPAGLISVLTPLTVKKRHPWNIVYQSEGGSIATNFSGLDSIPTPPLFARVRLQVNVARHGRGGHLYLEGTGDLCNINNQPMSLTIVSGVLGNDTLQDAALNDTDGTCVDIGAPVFKTQDVSPSVCPALILVRPPV